MFDYTKLFLRNYFHSKVLTRSHAWRATGALLAALSLTCGTAAYASSAAAPIAKHTSASYDQIPLSFEPNQGQTDASVKFLSRGPGYSLFLTKDEVVLNLERQNASAATISQKPASIDTLRMKLVGANSSANVTGLESQSGVVSYLIGDDPKKWHTGIETYGKVNFAQVYPGVDLVFYGNQRQLEYDFVVAPGADASRIAWQIDGAKPTIDADGNLVLSAANGPAGFKNPVIYQMDGDKKVAVEGAFTVAGNRIGFQLGSYDLAKPLIIDPVLTYATYLGGSSSDWIAGSQLLGNSGLSAGNVMQGVAIDSEGSAYVVGTTLSADFPVQNPYQSNPYATKSTGNSTVFITKFSPDGSTLLYSTYLGGSYSDGGGGIAVDSSGEAFVVGTTTSPDFPITPGAYQSICSPIASDQFDGYTHTYTEKTNCPGYSGSVFVAKLNATGSGLVYSTFLGGDGWTTGNAIAVDGAGRAYVGGANVGSSCALNNNYAQPTVIPYTCFPTTSGAVVSGTEPDDGHAPQGFIAVFDPTGANLLYSSLFSSLNPACVGVDPPNYDCINQTTYVNGVAVDVSGNFYIVGDTNAMFLPTTAGVIQPTTGPETSSDNPRMIGAVRGFVAKFNPVTATGGSSLAYATYLGGETAGSGDSVASITTDREGYAYVSGGTASTDFPVTTGAYQTSAKLNSAHNAAFIAKLNPTGTAIEWATYLGAATGNLDGVNAVGPIQLDENGNVYVTVQADGNYPSIGALENTWLGTPVFVSELDPTGSKLRFSAGFGPGNGGTMIAGGLEVDPAGNMYVAMTDPCAGAVVTPGSFQQTPHMTSSCAEFSSTGYVAKISATGTATVALAASPSPVSAGQSVTLTATVTPTATYASVPTGTIEFQDGGSALGTAVTLDATGKATYTSTTLAPGTHSLTAVYSGDTTYPTGNGAQKLVVKGLTATVKVTPSPASITTAMSLSVTVAVTGSGATPTGTVTLSGGGYSSSAATLTGGSATIAIPANSLSSGSDTLTVSYSGDASYNNATGTGTVTVTTPLTPSVKVTPSPASITTAMRLSVTVAVTGSGATPTGTVTLSGGGYNSSVATLTAGSATIAIPANSLSAGSDTLTVSYSGDASYNHATGTGTVTVTTPATPVITVTPASNNINTTSSLSVTIAVGGSGGVTPTGTVTLSGGGYTSTAVTLVNGSATIVIPANSLSVGNDTLTAKYSGDTNYAPASGTTPPGSPVTVAPTPIAPTVTVAPAATTANTGASLRVPVTVSGAGATPTGTVTLSGGGYTSAAATLANGSYTFNIPSNSLSAGADTLTAQYSGDSVYLTGSATASVTVKQSAYSLAATTPTAVTAGSPATSTVTASTTTAYSGTIALACALSNSPTGATHLPTCAVSTPSITLASGSASGTATVTVTTVGATAATALPMNDGRQNGWKHLGGGAFLAFLVCLGIPSRRRGWRAILGVLMLMAAIGTLSGCGGKSSSNSGNAGTTAGSYTFTVTGTGTPAETPAPTTTFTLTIN
jgi:hypothetical protein